MKIASAPPISNNSQNNKTLPLNRTINNNQHLKPSQNIRPKPNQTTNNIEIDEDLLLLSNISPSKLESSSSSNITPSFNRSLPSNINQDASPITSNNIHSENNISTSELNISNPITISDTTPNTQTQLSNSNNNNATNISSDLNTNILLNNREYIESPAKKKRQISPKKNNENVTALLEITNDIQSVLPSTSTKANNTTSNENIIHKNVDEQQRHLTINSSPTSAAIINKKTNTIKKKSKLSATTNNETTELNENYRIIKRSSKTSTK